jgi:hypothetical protein
MQLLNEKSVEIHNVPGIMVGTELYKWVNHGPRESEF